VHIIQWFKENNPIDGQFLRKYMPFLYYLFLKINYFNKEDKLLLGEKKRFGDKNPDKTFFVIMINNPELGLMAIYNCVVGYLRYLKKTDYIPIVDLINYNNAYLEKEEIGKKNSWEYYFEQPSVYTLDEVYQSKNVIIAKGSTTIDTSATILWFLYKYKNIQFRQYYDIIKKQVKINSAVQSKLDDEYNNILANKRVVGVVKRGSDLIGVKGHSIQPSMTELIAKTKEKLADWNCDYVFLATEEAETVAVFKNEFQDKLLINDSARVENYQKGVYYTYISFNRDNDKYLQGLEYLTTVYLLAQCTCLIGTLVGKTGGALMMNQGNYEHIYMYDLGVY